MRTLPPPLIPSKGRGSGSNDGPSEPPLTVGGPLNPVRVDWATVGRERDKNARAMRSNEAERENLFICLLLQFRICFYCRLETPFLVPILVRNRNKSIKITSVEVTNGLNISQVYPKFGIYGLVCDSDP